MELHHLAAVLFVTAALLPLLTESLEDWSYHGSEDPNTWKYHYPTCNGSKQSPINIVPKETIFNAGLADLAINYEPIVSAELQNNGHTVQATFKTGLSNISGGGLLSQFRALQMHFHWGSDNSHGSEHQVFSKKYPMEIHIVHYNAEKYPNASVATKKEDGLAVLGMLVEVTEKDNPVIKPIVDKLNATHYKGDNAFIQYLEPLLFLPQDQDFHAFYTYKGSLTTPGCYESVQWFLFNHTFKISSSQLEHFRDLSERAHQNTKDEHLEDNFRPVQPLNGRIVTRSFERPPFPCSKTSNSTMACSVLADHKVVFYEAVVNTCTLPATISLDVSQPDIRYNFTGIFYNDTRLQKIGNLDCGFALEMHSHLHETEPSFLHVSIGQFHPFSNGDRQEVITANFNAGVCYLGKCLAHPCDKHWCDGTAIGYNNDLLYVGFSSTFQDLTAANPSVDVNFYHNETGTWHLTASETFANNEEKVVHLMGVIVHDIPAAKRHRRGAKSQWEFVKFKAKITKTADKVLYQLLMVPSNGLYYRVLKDEYMLACVKPEPKTLSNTNKIAIGVSVVGMVVVLIGVTMAILYCRRKQYTSHQPALTEEMDADDDYRL